MFISKDARVDGAIVGNQERLEQGVLLSYSHHNGL